MAQPRTRCTPERIEAIATILRQGNFFATAVRACGIPLRTAEDWLRKGREGLQARRTGKAAPKGSAPYIPFAEAIEAADAECEQAALARIKVAAEGGSQVTRVSVTKHADGTETKSVTTYKQSPDWRADAWLLQRRYPQHWATKRPEAGGDAATKPSQLQEIATAIASAEVPDLSVDPETLPADDVDAEL